MRQRQSETASGAAAAVDLERLDFGDRSRTILHDVVVERRAEGDHPIADIGLVERPDETDAIPFAARKAEITVDLNIADARIEQRRIRLAHARDVGSGAIWRKHTTTLGRRCAGPHHLQCQRIEGSA